MNDTEIIVVLEILCSILMILLVVVVFAESIIHRRLLNVCKEYNKVCKVWEDTYSATIDLYDHQVEFSKVAMDEIDLYRDKYEAMVEKFGEVEE